jgi:hypothetical protein
VSSMSVLHAPWLPVRPEAQAQHMRRDARALVKNSQTDMKKRQKERILAYFHSDQGSDELLVDLEVHALVDGLNPALAVLLETTQYLSTCTNSQTATQPYLGVSSNLDSGDMLPNAKLQEERICSHASASCSLHRTLHQTLSTPNTAAFTSTHALEMDELTSSDKSIEPCAHTKD